MVWKGMPVVRNASVPPAPPAGAIARLQREVSAASEAEGNLAVRAFKST